MPRPLKVGRWKKRNISPYVEVISRKTRKIKIINLEEDNVFFNEETNTYQEVTNKTSNYNDDHKEEENPQ